MKQPRTRNPIPEFEYPEELPVSAKRHEIIDSLLKHPVIIVCGETGSGKTTQLPKICLEAQRGVGGMIGHTQPRRLAATSVAKRIASELGTPLGLVVGSHVRFSDRTDPAASIKLMTDGILLAETRSDPLLQRYDTIIIDEAHERSLNIDFLLGYLKQLLSKRRDLKIVVTSATIDATKFSQHFASDIGPAPVIEVSGRLYPVELCYRPVNSDYQLNRPEGAVSEVRNLIDSVVDAVDECLLGNLGDILVFLPGEREIRATAEALRQHTTKGIEVLPLFSRLSQQDQEKIFRSSGLKRVVLTTNLAETSLTVPGIRYVIDTGMVRIKRYNYRLKVEQLRTEPISQAAARQRMGRCGRIGPGVCIRLYEEADFLSRPEFTDPEIGRSSLAAVILRMKSLQLGEVDNFPFIDPPTPRAVADGMQLLQELGALDESQQLTAIGHALAKLPLDPRIGRMILAARERACLSEVMIIAAGLSVQDSRERPLESQEAAQQAHAKFNDQRCEFFSYVKLWTWYQEQIKHKKSQRQLMQVLRQQYLAPMRLREWQDVHTQLQEAVRQQGWVINQTPSNLEPIQLALLSGLLGNIGYKSETEAYYLGARGIRFSIHPSSRLVKKAGRWIMAAELVETTKLYGRCISKIDPQWLELVGSHLIKTSWSNPHWEKRAGQVVALQRGTLHGLVVYSGRRLHFGAIDPVQAREIFIRHALVEGQLDDHPDAEHLKFYQHNRRLIADIEKLEHQARRPDILVDEGLIFAFYDEHLPKDICQIVSLKNWYKQASKHQPQLLYLSREALMQHEAAGITTDVFPKYWLLAGQQLPLAYHFEPGSIKDGVTLSIPLVLLNQVSSARCEWLVPGMIKEKVHLLLKSLPQKQRRACVPLPDYAAAFVERHESIFSNTDQVLQKTQKMPYQPPSLIASMMADIREQTSQIINSADFKPDTLPAHLFMNFKVLDEEGRMLASSRSLEQLKAEYGGQAKQEFQQAQPLDENVQQTMGQRITHWSFGELPEILELKQPQTSCLSDISQSSVSANASLVGYPALIDCQTHCEIQVFDDQTQAQQLHYLGLLRLFRLGLKEQIKFHEKQLPNLTEMGMLYFSLGAQEQLRDQIIDLVLMQTCLIDPLPHNQTNFDLRKADAKGRLALLAQEISRQARDILFEWNTCQRKISAIKVHSNAYADIDKQLKALISKNFLIDIPFARLPHLVRYLRAVQARVEKLKTDPARDTRLMSDLMPLISRWQRFANDLHRAADPRVQEFRWLIEELRVALFAQELKTPQPVSIKRLSHILDSIVR